MLPLKYLPVNWVDGMNVAKEHFTSTEDAFNDRLRDAVFLQLTGYNYGLLPPVAGQDQSLELYFSYDAVAKEATVKVLRCRAITPAGARIEIAGTDFQGSKKDQGQPQATCKIDSFNTLAYDVVLSVDPFARVPYGQPDLEESPHRDPFVVPKYGLEVVPYPRVNRPESGAYQLTVGRIAVEGGEPKLSNHYIPPCFAMGSHRHLASLNDKFVKLLDELEQLTLKIIQKAKAQPGGNELNEDALYIADKLAYLLTASKDHYKWFSGRQSPLHAIEYVWRLARTLAAALECTRNKFELMDYYCRWLDWNPGRFENTLSGFLALEYRQEELFEAFKKAEDCLVMIASFCGQMAKVNRPGGPPTTPVKKVYGWLVVHTRGRRSEVFTLTKKVNVIGSADGAVDFNLADDRYISRQHATVEASEGSSTVRLTDKGSRHGTFIMLKNRLWTQIDKEGYVLSDGDTIQVGQTHLVFKAKDSAADEAQASELVERMAYARVHELTEA